jgi:hypothetical protein
MAEAEQYRRTSRDIWQAMAPGWERWQDQLATPLLPCANG